MKNDLMKRFLSSIIILPIVLVVIIKGSIFFNFFLFILFLLSIFEWININKHKTFYKIFGIIFLIFSFYSAYQFRNSIDLNFFLFIILICVFTDIGGYIFGKVFKGPKLTHISPNKTYSGVFGSLGLSVLLGLIFVEKINLSFEFVFYSKEFELGNIYEFKIIFFILIISVLSQIGDLIISYFKRLANVKDTGNILPGHGGVLDRIDGLIFVIPILYIYIVI